MDGTRDRPEPVILRSYRAVFDLEYRVYRIQRWSLPFPGGIALSTIAWTMGAAVVLVLAARLPLLGSALGLLPAPLRDVILPLAVGVLLSRYRPDGRAGHQFAGALLRHALAPGHVDGFRRCAPPGHVVRFADATVLRAGPGERHGCAGRLVGPGVVVIRAQARVRRRPGVITVLTLDHSRRWPGRRLRLRPGQRLVVSRPGPARGQR